MGRSTEPTIKSWWAVSALFALGAMALTALALALPKWPGTAVILVGAAAFVFTLRLHPDFWFRRMAEGAFGATCASGLLPNLSIDFLSESVLAKFVVDSGYVPTLVLAGLTGLFAVLDFFHQRARRGTRTPTQESQPPAAPANLHTEGDHSPVAGGDQTSARDGGVVVHVGDGARAEVHITSPPRVDPVPDAADATAEATVALDT
ncbi:MAG: hypothetical protein IID36_12480, partial [Planctomycetes bacterium]|nr:hypothetical protein [Planctomycetota bacterium]